MREKNKETVDENDEGSTESMDVEGTEGVGHEEEDS
jgi:hypothetical protein